MYRRRYLRPALWRDMERLRQDMDALVRSAGGRLETPPSFPAMNVWTGDDEAVITAEVPGISADEIELSVVGETLTLSGERVPEHLDENVRYHRRERGCGRFSRTIELPFRVDADRVEATFDRGVLRIELPRAETDKPKRITVASA
jgi:HSP20 family protein